MPTKTAAVCPVPADVSAASSMLEVWPRLGNDCVSGSSLPAAFQISVVVDPDRETVYLGAGDDFVNGPGQRRRRSRARRRRQRRISGLSGADQLFADDGAGETPNCGGADTVTVDALDRQRECETVTVR